MNVELVERARAGDRDAFDTLALGAVDASMPSFDSSFATPTVLRDAEQETLVRTWRDLHSLRDASRFDSWLHRLLIHAVNDEFRIGRRR